MAILDTTRARQALTARTLATVFMVTVAIVTPMSALDLWPVTGRTHQLRVHASAAGSALAGDTLYGGIKRIILPNGRVLTAGRCMLHCAAFRMPDPADPSRVLTLSLPPPDDLCALWRSAGGEPSELVLSLD